MKNTKIITFWGGESNPFANPEFANNGGGYSQPEGSALVELPNGSMAVVDYYDHNCGDFGRDAHVSVELLDGHSWGSLSGAIPTMTSMKSLRASIIGQDVTSPRLLTRLLMQC